MSLTRNKIAKDLSDPDDVQKLVGDYDIVVNAVPGFMGFEVLKTCIEAGKDTVELKIVDIDPEIAKNKWINERNNLFKDRRIEYYSILTEK